ncbi:PP2C family protein-serine/threonine phosphatase [Kitasatospora sp. NPDC048540]|uniref:PP2C family protein-serine/threonine phosphatase n=1 Tax=Kitasatospora sp. NPDC048540 TaxID=3155634 RepID=UPI0033C92507
MPSLRRLTGSRLLLAALVTSAALLAAGVAVVGVVLNRHHEEAAQRIETRWRPAATELGDLRAAAGDVRAACLAGPAGPALREAASGRLENHLVALGSVAAGADQEVESSVAAVRLAGNRWLADTGPGAAVDVMPLCAVPASAASADAGPAMGTYAALDARTVRLAALLEDRRRREVEGTAWHMAAVMLYILALSAALLLAAVVAAVVLQRRHLSPAAVLAENLWRTAGGITDASAAPGSGRGWLGRLTQEAEGVRRRLDLSQRQSRRDQEALVQIGPAVRGLREVLTARDAPGRGVAVAGDVRAAEGLIAGDYLGTVVLPGGAMAVFLGDVCGHGVDAGLLAARLKTVTQVGLRLGRDLDTVLHALWQALVGEEERFTTLAIAVLDPQRSTLTWASAGHEEPFLRRGDGTVERLPATGPIVHPLLDAPPGHLAGPHHRPPPGGPARAVHRRTHRRP